MDDNGYAGATLRRRRLLPCVPINSSAGCENGLDGFRGQKPQSWAGPAVSPGRQRRVSSFLGSREAGFGLRSRFGLLLEPAPSGARSRPGADLSAETEISSPGGSAPGVSDGLCVPTDVPSGRRSVRAKPQVMGVIGVFDPYRRHGFEPRWGLQTQSARSGQWS
jgi:hypothetical protein